MCFNLKRDARPLATYIAMQRQPNGVSISSEMPGPWRRTRSCCIYVSTVFQSQARCQAPGDADMRLRISANILFQSQARCQAPGDMPDLAVGMHRVSISSEMPGPWRRKLATMLPHRMFQSQARCQAPGDYAACSSSES